MLKFAIVDILHGVALACTWESRGNRVCCSACRLAGLAAWSIKDAWNERLFNLKA